MQAVKEKLSDMKVMRQAKAEAKEEEKAEKELAKSRVEIAHEVRLAREAEAAMELHVTKAAEKADREIAKHEAMDPSLSTTAQALNDVPVGAQNPHNRNPAHFDADNTMGMGYNTNTPGTHPTNNLL
ncbi:hypothetical protein F0562_014618 [Nyssa sinensis]|uniref:Late embryogenesis abundant protein n=1 Tax=Nyssa sinensis TaxID=561372 RepID=A0A5J4ZSJ5_9ASTE|nr:hypothetical protein F0562_014618 [Nyssa sinensis]